MQVSDLITTIENEISRLQQARKLLAGTNNGTRKSSRRRKRMLSAEGRERIAAAQHRTGQTAKSRPAATRDKSGS